MKTKTKVRAKSRPAHRKTVSSAKLKAVKRQVRHSKPLHHRLALHPISVFTLLLIGVFLSTWTIRTLAASTTISATIEAPALTTAATIASPNDGDTVTDSAVTVIGNCPAASYVNLTINGSFSGSDMCSSGTYHILSSLTSGANTVQVQAYNLSDRPGPATDSITVTYDDSGVLGASTTQSNALLLTSNFSYKTYNTAENFDWTMQVSGGQPPYTVSTDWADGSKPTITVYGSEAAFHIVHHYDSHGSYIVRLQAVDAQHQVRLLQLPALITDPGSTYVPGVTSTKDSGSGSTSGINRASPSHILTVTKVWLLVAWPSFIIVILMALSFWLGERQELREIFAKKSAARAVKNRKYRHA